MKRCPLCNRVYTDPTLNFCLADGKVLSAATDPNIRENATAPSASEAPTEAFPSSEVTNDRFTPTLPSTPPQFVRPVYTAPPPLPTSGHRKPLVWIIAGILLTGVVVEAYFLMRKNPEENQAAAHSSANNANSANINTRSSSMTPTPTPTVTPSVRPTPSATPTPTPNTAAARSEVLAVMNSWAESLRRQDLSANLRLYADHLDAYYQLGSASREQVRANRQAIFARYYSSTGVQLSNISIALDSSGTKATVSYDNAYDWRGGAKSLVGKSHNEMILSKVGTQWLITSEKHLQTYYENSGN